MRNLHPAHYSSSATRTLTEAQKVKIRQGLLIRFLNARIAAFNRVSPSMLARLAAIEELKMNFTANQYTRMLPFCRAVVTRKDKIESVYPGRKSRYYNGSLHKQIIELLAFCEANAELN